MGYRDEHGDLLHAAWTEWEESISLEEMQDDYHVIEPMLSKVIDETFANPSTENESSVQSLWSSSFKHADSTIQRLPDGVYASQLLTQSGIAFIRSLLDKAVASGIPTRRPNGMNRNGVILDRKVNGAIPVAPLIDLIESQIIDHVLRPVGRLLFQEYIGCNDDIEYFAFTIRYDGGDLDDNMPRDIKLKEHRDASVITLNVNLNLHDEGYSGSDVFFREFPRTDSKEKSLHNDMALVKFSPGMAIIHLGAHRHGSIPILQYNHVKDDSMRYNLVIWLFGEHGDVRIAPYSREEQMNIVERWHGCDSVRGVISNIHNFVD